jgi:putative tributyrin esterase
MAVMTMNFFSTSMGTNETINVFVPTPEGSEQYTNNETQKAYEKGLPVVYLLHGAYGNYASWMRFSSVERYGQEHRCVLVMPSGGNSFYQDMPHGLPYKKYITEELPALITSLFPVSKKREDTMIAGFSMGGYGAWYYGLACPEKYAKAASMSGALDVAGLVKANMANSAPSAFSFRDIFADPEHLAGSEFDLMTLAAKDKKEGIMPELYQACGTEDFLIETNRSVHQKLTEMNIPVVYEEGAGMHNWYFWDEYIRHILNWMFPGEKK